MRRKEKEITLRTEIDAVIDKAQVCRLAMADGSRAYIVPMSFGYDGRALYFHSAKKGKKLDILSRNSAVCFEVDTDVSATPAATACKWGMTYQSVIGHGEVEFITDPDAVRGAMDVIMAHYAGKAPFEYSDAEVNRVCVFKVNIHGMTGKRSGCV